MLKGLSRAKRVYENRGERVKELKSQGKKVVGYICMFAPPEIMTAAGVVPYRLRGNPRESITKANAYIETYGCPYVRNLFDQDLKGYNDFLDGIVMSHSCDMVQRVYGIWTYYNKPAFSYFVNVPHTPTPWSQEFFTRELGFFKKKMEDFSGKEITDDSLRQAIKLHNKNRALVRTLYKMREQDPPLLSGTETLEVLVAGMVLPVAEFNGLLEEVIEEVTTRKEHPKPKPARFLIYGCVCDDITFVKLVEETGANVVIDDTCIGTRTYWDDVSEDKAPLESLAVTYFIDFPCPRTYFGTTINRFKYIGDLAHTYKVNGIIMYIYSFCDPHKFDVPDALGYLSSIGLPVLVIDDDYTMANLAAIRTRVQAFIEMIT